MADYFSDIGSAFILFLFIFLIVFCVLLFLFKTRIKTINKNNFYKYNMYIKSFKIYITIFLLFVSQIIIAQDKIDALREALKNGTPDEVKSLISEQDSLSNSKHYFLNATLNPNINYVKQNYALLLEKGCKIENEYRLIIRKLIDNNRIELIPFLLSQPEWDDEERREYFFVSAYEKLEKDSINTIPSALEILINHGLDVNSARNKKNIFEFSKRCYNRAYENDYHPERSITAFKKLISFGMDINTTNDKGQTILHKQALRAPDSIITLFKELGANPTLKNKEGKTLGDLLFKPKLIQIIKNGSDKQLDSILKKGMPLYNESYLYLIVNNATKNTVFKKVKTVMKHGYSFKDYGGEGYNEMVFVMRVAIDSNAYKLREYTFNTDKSLHHQDKLDIFYKKAILSLHTLPEKEESSVQFLIDKGLDINSVKNKNALLEFANKDYSDERKTALKHLVSLFPVDVNFQNKDGNTMLHLAALSGSGSRLSFFEELGVDFFIENNNGLTAYEIYNTISKKREREELLEDNMPLILFLASLLILTLTIVFRKKINDVALRIIVSFINALSISYLISCLVTIGSNAKESALEIMILFFAFGAVLFIPLFFIIQYIIFKALKNKE